MRGFRGFLGKEAFEFVSTWRVWVLGGFLMFFAIASPILAKMTPEILASVGAGQPGVVITIPDPTWRDSYLQWIKNLSQMGTMIVIVIAAGSVASELASGTAQLVLSKPVSRPGFVLAKYVALAGFVVIATAVATALVQAETFVVFGSAPAAELWKASAAWLGSALLLSAVALLASTVLPTLAAVGVSVVVFLLLPVLSMWPDAARYSPAGLLGAPGDLIMGTAANLAWPVGTSAIAVLGVLAVPCALFSRREL